MSLLKEKYNKEIKNKLRKELDIKNVMQVPYLDKITVNAGVGGFKDNKDQLSSFVEELADLTGQKPSPRKAKLSESGFKIRKGEIVGYTVTLRGDSMWAFLEKFVNVVLPRVRDFQGVSSKSFDKSGNYSIGIREHVIFPEVNPNKVKASRSLQVNFRIKSESVEHSKALLTELGMPFQNK